MRLSSAFFGLLLVVSPAVALALQQPDGTVIPVGPSLQALFDSRGEAISALNDAATTPETFTPSCQLTFEVLQRNAGYQNSFGWYNVTGTKPTAADLHEFIACNDPVGTIKVLDIKNDPAWTGGEVAFYEATGSGCPTPASNENVFFSQKAYNPDSSQQNPTVHLITYNSTATAKAFYFAWEDLLAGGDNDFDDLTMFVTGITCSGGGVPCDTGLLGVCASGILQCQSGVLACVPTVQPQTESCDGFDNDCNDLIDEGDLCQPGFVCDQGNCVPACSGGEFQCPPGSVCNEDGLCVDAECVMTECPPGEKCVDGECLGPCENVVCPYGQVCQLDVCVDPCAPIACDAEQVCVAGVCLDKCPCRDCAQGEVCQPDGTCLAAACDGVTCSPGEHCDPASGQCVDDCLGASCPLGQVCQAGECVEDTTGQGGAGGGSTGSFGTGAGTTGGTGGSSGSQTGSGGQGGAGGDATDGSSGGCDCRSTARATSRADTTNGWIALGLLAASWIRRRRGR
jgi:MYXO-CTERM domain-containing protein